MRLYAAIILIITLLSCSRENNEVEKGCFTPQKEISFSGAKIITLSDKDYPNNPDISLRSSFTGAFQHDSIYFKRENKEYFTLKIMPGNETSDTLFLDSILLAEFIPTVPEWIKDNEYLSFIGFVNQEWNRQQVQFSPNNYKISSSGTEYLHLKRVDIARNCLNSYLWEIILYTEEKGESKPYYHGWFNFPDSLYHQIFQDRNEMDFCKYEEHLAFWKDPESKKIDFNELRTITESKDLSFENHNTKLYPLGGERKKKQKNIIFPKEVSSINDFLSDSTKYATFSPPGFYDYSNPRKTYLSQLATLKKAELSYATSANKKDSIIELSIQFARKDSITPPLSLVCGFQPEKVPVLDLENSYKGYQMPMGISNHSFYESYSEMKKNSSLENPFYALLVDIDGNFIDSHKIGIDGPLFYFDKKSKKLHLFILSFERHSFVGHYEFNVTKNELSR